MHQDKYKKNFDTVVAFIPHYIDKRAPTPSVKVASVHQTRPAERQKTSSAHGTFKGKIKLKKYSREEFGIMSMVQHQQLYELQKQARHIKGTKTPQNSSALEARVALL